jgi:predicted transcriptional regulator
MQNLIEKLQEYGLSKKEAEIYCHLLRLGTVTIGPLCRETKSGRQSVYHAMEDLIKRGLAFEERIKGKPRVYTAHRPQALLEEHAQQQKILQNLTLDLEILRGSGQTVGDVEIVRGVVPFQSFLEKCMKLQKDQTVIRVLNAGGDAFLTATKYRAFFTRYENIRLNKKMSHKLLMYADQRNTNPTYTKRRLVETRFLPTELSHIPVPAIIWQQGVSLLLFTDEPQIIHIASKHVAQGYAAQFEALWKMGSA